jgi:hypothetical protein
MSAACGGERVFRRLFHERRGRDADGATGCHDTGHFVSGAGLGRQGDSPNGVIFFPNLYDRSGAANWKNHAELNSRPGGAGPGVIQPPIHITFNKLGRYVAAAGGQWVQLWGAFDGSDAPPVWFWGSDTNINSLVVESRLVRTNATVEFEWTTLRLGHHAYRVEVSTNLTDWMPFTRIEPYSGGWANAFTQRHPIGESSRFFRSIKEPWVP